MVRRGRQVFPALLCLAALTFQRCAQTVPLTGGPDDVDPPVLVKSDPDTFQTYFNTDRIKLEFNEYVELDNIRKNLLITPVLRYQPQVLASGKKIIIRNLDDSLWANTTYVMDFNEAIHDITEKNKAKGFQYVFSTGSYVDSLEIEGIIRDAFTLKPIADAFALVYPGDATDSIPYKSDPRYVARSDENGVFRIRNMKKGTYKLFFNSDDNRNYRYDVQTERIDFLDTGAVVSNDTVARFFGYLFQEADEAQFLKGYGSEHPGSFYLSYNRPVDSLYFNGLNRDMDWLEHFSREWDEEGDSVVYWRNDSLPVIDTLAFFVRADTLPFDTLEIYLKTRLKQKKVNPRPQLAGTFHNLGEDLEFRFDYPLVASDTSHIYLIKDSLGLNYSLNVSNAGRQWVMKANWEAGQTYKLIFDSASLVDIHNNVNDSTSIVFEVHKTNYYGTLDLVLSTPDDTQGILQLLNSGGKVEREVILSNSKKHFFTYLTPGEYKLKYIVDENGNGQWDPGKYLKNKHAERVFIYQKSIVVRSNWDQVIEWKMK